MCMIAPIVSKMALSEQKQGGLNTSVSVVAPEMQYNRSKSISHTFFTLLSTKGGVAGDVAGATRAQLLLLNPIKGRHSTRVKGCRARTKLI